MEWKDRVQSNPRLLRLKNPVTGEIIDYEIQDLNSNEIEEEGTEVNADNMNAIEKNIGSLTDTYSSNNTYNIGDLVIYNGLIYKCVVSISTPEAWYVGHWEQIGVAHILNQTKETHVKVSPTEPTTGEKVWIQKGKNEFSFLETSQTGQTATIVEIEPNKVALEGQASTYQYITLKKKLKAGTYSFQRKWSLKSGTAVNGTGAVIIVNDATDSSILTLSQSMQSGSFTITEETVLRITLYVSIDTALTQETQIEIYDVQLEKGSTATSFEEYVEKRILIKEDEDYEELINVEIIGKNTDWIELNNYISYKKQNGIVFVIGNGQGSREIGNGAYTNVGTLPEMFRPSKYFYFTWGAMGGDLNNQSARIETNGNISLYLPSNRTTSNWTFITSFPT